VAIYKRWPLYGEKKRLLYLLNIRWGGCQSWVERAGKEKSLAVFVRQEANETRNIPFHCQNTCERNLAL
jgi:hypothetical protein